MSDAELDEKRRVAREALLAVARLTPAEVRYFESPQVDPGTLQEKLCDALMLLVGGVMWPARYVGVAPQELKLKYVPFEVWDQWEQAQERLEILQDVYPELELEMQLSRGPEHQLFILWSEKVLQLSYQQLVN